jgi:H+-transporting ATPase
MADTAAGQHGDSNTSSDATPPNHLGTNVPSGHFESSQVTEKQAMAEPEKQAVPESKAGVGLPEEDDDEEEDIDALIDDLESLDGHAEEEEDEVTQPGGARPVSEDLLQTDTRIGLSAAEVEQRRRKFGLNQMKEEKENLILKFLMYFVGPIQFVMEVSRITRAMTIRL